MTKISDLDAPILMGAELRVFLNSEHISYGEIQSTLKDKGIYTGESDKIFTVPLLSATLLTPDNFSKLMDASKARESQPKSRTEKLELTNIGVDWIDPIRNIFHDTTRLLEGIPNIDFILKPNVVIKNDTARIPYIIIRKDFSQDLLNRELEFDGEITLETDGKSLTLNVAAIHSSKETEEVNKKITNNIAATLYKSSIITKDVPTRILFDIFTNESRIVFFKKLTGGFGSPGVPGNVNDIEISRDIKAGALPADPKIEWMNQTVRRIKIDGVRLNDIFLISDKKYYSYYHLLRMDVTFPYSFGQNQGECQVSFSFSGIKRDGVIQKNSELVSTIIRTTYSETTSLEGKRDIAKLLSKSIMKLIDTHLLSTP